MSTSWSDTARADERARSPQPRRFDRWLDRRIPAARRIRLGRNSIFILPTAQGFAFIGLILLLVVAAINYQNSLIYALAFLLVGLLMVTIIHTYCELAGITLELDRAERAFSGDDVAFVVRGARPGTRPRIGIHVGAVGVTPRHLDLASSASNTSTLQLPAEARGWFNPGRFIVETYYPLGLVRAWSWVDLEAKTLIYPRPMPPDRQALVQSAGTVGAFAHAHGSEDFDDLRPYRPGDPMRHVLWRAYARSGELVVRQQTSDVEPRMMFDWHDMTGDAETRLSRLTGLVLAAVSEQRPFGLRIPGTVLPVDGGERHLQAALEALALYGL
jgi:uncharacterized protein (DUF58 family)